VRRTWAPVVDEEARATWARGSRPAGSPRRGASWAGGDHPPGSPGRGATWAGDPGALGRLEIFLQEHLGGRRSSSRSTWARSCLGRRCRDGGVVGDGGVIGAGGGAAGAGGGIAGEGEGGGGGGRSRRVPIEIWGTRWVPIQIWEGSIVFFPFFTWSEPIVKRLIFLHGGSRQELSI
jgi:hypothetical protein